MSDQSIAMKELREVFEDLGDDYFQRRHDPDRQARRLVAQLEELGFAVTINAA
ncbi:MAG: hypothetical protein NVS3B10_22060 [Polyangiales bacterium]